MTLKIKRIVSLVREKMAEEKITDWQKAYPTAIGFAAIDFRDSAKPEFYQPYILNGDNDGWFRKKEGQGKGYGLSIINAKLTSDKALDFGSGKAYKANIKYIPSSKEEESDAITDKFWIFVHNKFKIEDVMSYIKKHQNSWRP